MALLRELLQIWLEHNPEANTEYHFPGQSYTGPGTHIVTRILNHDIPKNKTDFVTMLHDIEYMGGTNPRQSDIRAVVNSDWSLPGIATKIGLSTRMVIDSLPGVNLKFNVDKGLSLPLMQYVMLEPTYARLFQQYNISPMQYLSSIKV